MAAASVFLANLLEFRRSEGKRERPFRGRTDGPRRALAWLCAATLIALSLFTSRAAFAAGEDNLLTGMRAIHAEGVRNAAVLTDGFRAGDGDDWNTTLTAVFTSGRAYAEFDLGRSVPIVAAYLQGDNNDRYVLSISEDGKQFKELWVAGPVDKAGLQPRSSASLRGQGRYLRVSAREGDGSYSLSELQVFEQRPSTFPPKIQARGGTNMAPRLRTAFLIFALAWAAFLFAIDKRSGQVWLLVGAIAPLAAAYSLYDVLWDGWPAGLREVSLARAVSAAIAGLALLRATVFRKRFPAHRIPVIAALSVSAALAFASFYNLGHPQFWNAKESRPEFVHTWDMRVYYPFTKYFEEIGYDGVYEASVEAYVESVPGTTLESIGNTEIRSMKTHRMQRVSDVANEIANVSKRFSKERWEEFKRDMTYFREVMGAQYLTTHHDHGSNATPVWVLFAKLIFDGRPASEGVLVFGGLVDAFLLAGAFAAMWWAYGLVPALLAMVVFGANDFYMFGTNWGGATLRHDWLAYLAVGVCMLKKERWVLGGVFFGLSTMIRAFPGAALIGVVLPALWWLYGRWQAKDLPGLKELLERNQSAVKVLLGAAGCMLFAFALSTALLGFDAWVVWWKKIILLNADVGLNDVALKSLVGGNDGSTAGTLNNRALVYWAAFFAALAAVGLACRSRPLDQAAILALPLIPVLTNPANYYVHFIFLLPLLGSSLRSAIKKDKAKKVKAVEAIPEEAPAADATPASEASPQSEESPATTAPADVEEAVAEAAPEPPRREKRRKKRDRGDWSAWRETVPIALPHLAVSGPLLVLCIAQYWTVLDPDIERHFQLATAFFFATMAWLYVRVLAADGVFETGSDAPPPAV
jgi:hypothetical protein